MNPFSSTAGLLNETVIEVFTSLAVFAGLIAAYVGVSTKTAVNSRAKSFIQRRRETRSSPLRAPQAPTRRKSVQAVRGLLERLKLTQGVDVRKSMDLLARAGWRTPEALTIFLGFRLTMPIFVGVAAFIVASILFHSVPPMSKILISLVGVAAGAFGPSIFVANAGDNRGQKIQKGLPDALDLFVICAEAGLSLDAAVSRVTREIRPAAPELADELGLTAVELGFLPNRRDALMNLGKRVPTPAIRNLVTTLAQTERYGTPLAQSLRVLAGEFRDTRMMKAEEKAARLPAILTVPMIVFILPPLFVVLVGPAVIQVLASLPK